MNEKNHRRISEFGFKPEKTKLHENAVNQMIRTVSTKSNGTELNQNKNFSCSILLVGVKVSTKKRGKRKVIHHAVNNPNSFLY